MVFASHATLGQHLSSECKHSQGAKPGFAGGCVPGTTAASQCSWGHSLWTGSLVRKDGSSSQWYFMNDGLTGGKGWSGQES